MGYWAAFDYERMAREAAKERDALHALLERRKKNPPERADQELVWQRENSLLYTMYLEQRCSAEALSRRARMRARQEAAYGA